MALDTISFLLSKYAPKTAQTTMSPALKDAVPIGTVEARILKDSSSLPSDIKSAELVSQSYKVQGFTSAAERANEAAARLKQEAANETRYWDEILALKEQGWAVSKVPREPRSLGVHFGFREAAAPFRSRGFAALRRTEDGSLRLDQGAVPSSPVSIRVSVIRGDQSIAVSSIPRSKISSPDSVNEQILQARNTLFEEELFYELGREARLLANQGATMSQNQISMPISDESHVQVDLVGLDAHNSPEDLVSDQPIANGIAVALRILLSHAHEQALRRRSQPPAPLSVKARPLPEYALLRPVIAHLRHAEQTSTLSNLLKSFAATLSTATLSCTAESSSSAAQQFFHRTTPEPQPDQSPELVASLIKPISTTFSFHLPSEQTLDISMTTNLNPPTFGTDFSLTPQHHPLAYPLISLTIPSLPRLSSLAELESLLIHILTIDLVSMVIASSPHEGSGPTSPVDPTEPESLYEGRENVWTSQEPHSGVISLGRRSVTLKVVQDTLAVRYLRGDEAVIYSWTADGERQVLENGTQTEIARSLLEAVGELGS